MSLRARLAGVFVAVTVVPLVIAVVALGMQTAGHMRLRAEEDLVAVRAAAIGLVEGSALRATDLATDLRATGEDTLAKTLEEQDAPTVTQWLSDALDMQGRDRADLVLLTGIDGGVLAMDSSPPSFLSEEGSTFEPHMIAQAARRRQPLPGLLLDFAVISAPSAPTEVAGYLVVGLWTDREFLDRLPLREDREGAAVVTDGRILATRGGNGQLPSSLPPASGRVMETTWQGMPALVTTTHLANTPASLVLWSVLEPQTTSIGWLLVAGSAMVAGLVGWLLAGSFAAPIRRALVQSERSRDELRRSLSRLGQTLSSSLDLSRTLSVVVETAMGTLAADRGLLMLLTPERDALFAKVGRGVGSRVPSVRMGQGLAGWVAKTGTPLRLPADAHRAQGPERGEPVAAHQLFVPLLGRGQVIGVLSLLRDDAMRPFTQSDLDTVTSFAAQASVGIENVLLHREAQRLAVTDPLTGLWNFRYFQIQADRELESAVRFAHPLSLVIVDLDHFKEINDGLGHQVGDEVLNEVARRIRDSTRVPDVVARYGGEEFVVLLPGTGRSGAIATAERIRQAVDSPPVSICVSGQPMGPLRITCSAGVASFPTDGQTIAALLRSADAAMYVAKSRGRNRVVAAGNAVLSEVPWRANPSAMNV